MKDCFSLVASYNYMKSKKLYVANKYRTVVPLLFDLFISIYSNKSDFSLFPNLDF